MKNVFLQLSIIGILFIFVPTGMKANTAPEFHPHTETRHENTRCCSGQRLKVAGCNGKQKTGKTMPDKCPTKFVIFTKKAATNECELRLEGPSGYYIA